MELIDKEYYWLMEKSGYLTIGRFDVADYGDNDIEERFVIMGTEVYHPVDDYRVLSHIDNPYRIVRR